MKIFSYLSVFSLSFLIFFHPMTDFSQDLGRHIKLGEIILTTHQIPKTNLFSYTYPDFPFINHHWLSEVVFFLINTLWGTYSLAIIMFGLAAVAITLLFSYASKRTSFFAAFISLLLYLSILLERTYLRPEIFSFFFMSVFLVILYRFRDQYVNHTRYLIFLLPFLEILWVNMHIYFVIGPLLIFLFFIDSGWNYFKKSNKFSTHNSQFSINFQNVVYQILNTKYPMLLLVFLLTCLATLFNPHGLTGALYPLHVFSNYGYSIEENQSLYFLINYGLWFPWFTTILIAIAALAIMLFAYHKKTALLDWLLVLTFSLGALLAVRNFSLFVFGTYVVFVQLMSSFSKSFEKNLFLLSQKTKAVACLLGFGILLYITFSSFRFGLSIDPGPQKAVDFFLAHHLKGPIFNDFDIGSYLDYRLYPSQRVFVDGRPEAYPANFFQNEYIPMQENPAIFSAVEQKYHFQSIFLSHRDATPWAQAFLATILKDPSWKLIYIDGTIVILVPNQLQNQQLFLSESDIARGKIPFPNDLSSLTEMARVFQVIQWPQAEIAVLQKELQIDAHSCTALGQLTRIFQEENNPMATVYGNLYNQSCQ